MTGRTLPILVDDERTALRARWPEPVLSLSDEDRQKRVRVGGDSVMLDETDGTRRVTRGFVRAVLRVPLGHPMASVYGVFVEVDKLAYQAIKGAHSAHAPARVWGKLATRLPLLEDAFDTEVELLEDGSELRARVVAAKSPLLVDGPLVGRP